MRISTTFLALVALSASVAYAQPSYFTPSCGQPAAWQYAAANPAACEMPAAGGACDEPAVKYEVAAEALFLHRAASGTYRELVENFSTGDPVLTTQSDQVDWGAGWRVDGSVRFRCGWGLDVAYFDANNWTRTNSFSNSTDFFLTPVFPVVPPLVPVFTNVSTTYSSDLRSAEFNVPWQLGDNLSALMGFRYMHLGEDATMSGVTVLLDSAAAHSRVTNDLYGFQVGLKLASVSLCDPLHLDGFVKGGLYGNCVARSEQTSGEFGDSSIRDSASFASFVGEASLRAVWDLSEHLAVYGGYEALWLTETALAPAQFGQSDTIDARATLFYQQIVTGVEAKW